MGYKKCVGDHRYARRDLGAGLQRLECEICGSVVIDLDAAQDGRSPVTVPGLFNQSRPTIFSMLRQGGRVESAPDREETDDGLEGGPGYAVESASEPSS
ncbi:MAG: hypothetical protein WB239_00185 [Acidimicrobiia bacterium]